MFVTYMIPFSFIEYLNTFSCGHIYMFGYIKKINQRAESTYM